MTDEPRRSGRSTKGQHKNLDMMSEPPKKPRAKALPKEKPSKPSAEPTPAPSEEDEIIRCICGEYEEEEDVERDMICCDKCSAWQHNDCMGLTFGKGEEPDEYFCELCKPENHKVLLEKMARGEKPWEEAAEIRRRQAEEKKPVRRRKGKRGGRRGRPSEAKTGAATETPPGNAVSSISPSRSAPPTATPGLEEKNGVAKRKFDEHEETAKTESGPKLKQQKVSPQTDVTPVEDAKVPLMKADSSSLPSRQGSVASAEKPVAAIIGTPEEIPNPARKRAATALIKLFVDLVAEARKQGSFSLPDGQSAEDVARHVGLSIENAMYQNLCGASGEPTEPYKLQLRTILFNVKRNRSLRDRLLVGSLSADVLSKMNSQDMASEELQQKDAEIKREAERQHIIVQEQGPRIRRTHKGEELVEDESHNAATESIFSTAPTRRSIVDADGTPSGQSPSSPNIQHQPELANSRQATRPPPIDTKAGDFNSHDNLFQPSVHSPGASNHDSLFPEVATHIREPLPSGRVQADAEIDHLLRDEEPDSPPYSPKDYNEEGTIWRGRIVLSPISEFSSSAKHVGGADLSAKIPWSQLMPPELQVDGRIDVQLASNYLCGLRFSGSTDVSVTSVRRPEFPVERAGFDKLFNYFWERKRYGVIGKHALPAVKDTYVIPLEAGSTKPEFIELLDNTTLEDPTPERILLVVFVVRTGESAPSSEQPPSLRPSQEPGTAGSPVTIPAGTPQHHHPLTPSAPLSTHISPTPPTAYAASPVNGPYGNPGLQPETQQQHPSFPPHAAPQYQQHPVSQAQQASQGLSLALQIIGPQAHSPVVRQVIQQAPNADASQLSVLRDILYHQPNAASSYETLVAALYQATNNQQQKMQ